MIKKMTIVIIISLVIIVLAALMITLINNQANLLRPPGIKQRLLVFFTQNTAVTDVDHTFPELQTPEYARPARQVFRAVLESARQSGWRAVTVDEENLKAEFEVSTPVFGFVDDVTAQVILIDMNASKLHIQSHSRKGTGDLAANSGHIQTLISGVNKRLGYE